MDTAGHIHRYDWYDDPDHGYVKRCECGQLDPDTYSSDERGYPEEPQD